MANKKRKRLGHTRPRLSNAPIKGKSRVDEVAKLAEQIGMPLLPWQHHVLEDMLKIDSKGNFHTTESNDYTGLFPAITGPNGTTNYMSTVVPAGACNSCHGVSTAKLYAN